jgi:hypothetical protein
MKSKSIYQPPDQCARDTTEMSNIELRNHYAQDEICVQAVAWLYLFSGSFVGVLSLIILKFAIELHHLLLVCMNISILLVASVFVLLGWGMRHYDPWSRTPARFAAFVMMVFVPIGTLIGIICFFLLKQRAHEDIFSNKYHAILLSDPLHGKYQTTWLPMVVGALTAILMAFAVVFQRHTIANLLDTASQI